ncbi:hypothetical protein OAQ08_01390 [Alphaproteobacteria bacterium]|nr:hypothetical protein [Alphaproteobacteria bacterium]
MKKKYYIIIILFILGALIILANIRLPVSFITKEKINEISNNQINLISFDKQYFKLLPAPYIILTDPILEINIKNLTSKINIDKIEINRSLLDQKNYSILIGEGFIDSTSTNFKNLELELSLKENGFDLSTSKFKLDQSDIQFDFLVEKNKLKSFSFDIKKLNFKKNYQFMNEILDLEYLKNLDLNSEAYINAQGIYDDGQIIFNKAEIKLLNNSSILFEGIVNLDDLFLSSLEVLTQNIDKKILMKLVKSANKITDFINVIPQGKIASSKLIIEDGSLNLELLEYITNEGNELTLKSQGMISDIYNPNLDLKLIINNFEELEDIKNIFFKNNTRYLIEKSDVTEGYIDLELRDKLVEIKNIKLITSDKEKFFFNGDYDIDQKNFGDLKIEIKDLSRNKFENILQLYENQISKKYLKLLNFDKINTTIAISPKDQLILVTKLELIGSDTSTIKGLYKNEEFAGSANIKKINLQLLDKILLKTNRIEGYLNLDISSNGLIGINTIKNIAGSIDGEVNIKIENSEIALLNFLQSLTADVEDLEAFNTFSQILTNSFMNRTIKYEGELHNNTLNRFEIKNLNFIAPDGKIINSNIIVYNDDFEVLLIDVFKDEDLILTRKNGSYNFMRSNSEGVTTKPVEDIIKKNLNQLFENLLN